MKVTYGESNLEASNGVTCTTSFRIQANGHAFAILSKHLYADPIKAVIRELACNAQDAHIEQGEPDLPIEVKLPNRLDTQFYVKDYGIGLDAEGVMGLYTTYFQSTKSESDEYTGAFGLGSKSPFAYVDTFTVTAVKDGVKRIFTAHIGADGSPALSQLFEGEADIDWQHGLMVSFPVKDHDFSTFSEKAQEVFKWFRVTPSLLGNTVKIEPAVFAGDGGSFWKIGGKTEYGAKVIMGNVAYPLDPSRVSLKTEAQRILVRKNVHLFVPIGTVQVAASREELHYDEASQARLLEWLDRAGIKFGEFLYKQYYDASVKSEWDRMSRFCDLVRQTEMTDYAKVFLKLADLPEAAVIEINKMAMTNGFELTSGFTGQELNPVTGLPKIRLWYLTESGSRSGSVVRREVTSGHTSVAGTEQLVHIPYKHKVAVCLADAPYATQRVRNLVQDSEYQSVLFVSYDKGMEGAALKFAQERAEALGQVPLILSSTLPKPVVKKAKKGERATASAKLARFKTELVGVLDPADETARISEAQVGFILPENQFFIIRADKSRSSWRRRYWVVGQSRDRHAATAAMTRYCEFQRKFPSQLQAIKQVAVITEAQAKRLQLQENGWKEVTTFMQAQVSASTIANTLAKGRVIWTDANIDSSYDSDTVRGGLFAVLTKAAKKGLPFFEFLKDFLKGTSNWHIVEAIQGCVDTYKEEYKEDKARIREFLDLCDNLGLSELKTKADGCRVLKSFPEKSGELKQAYPALELVDTSQFYGFIQSQPAKAALIFVEMLAIQAIPEEQQKVA